MLQRILVLLLSLILVLLFIITGSHLTVLVSCKGVSDSAELLQNNDASAVAVLNNVNAAVGKESKLKPGWNVVVDKIHIGRESFLAPIQRSSSAATEKVESPAEVADRKSEMKVTRRRLIVKEKTNESGFVAYSADYGKPRHHPPKNN